MKLLPYTATLQIDHAPLARAWQSLRDITLPLRSSVMLFRGTAEMILSRRSRKLFEEESSLRGIRAKAHLGVLTEMKYSPLRIFYHQGINTMCIPRLVFYFLLPY